ncbi:MAG: tetratricopeptide repeat protein [Candidatus Aegiribacteria sp.]|nr:tetratricopeptide repeat protein [Candidatus Aegiribacteria sp.]
MPSNGAHFRNQPVLRTEFVGREDELQRISYLLQSPICRVLTLIGPGGIGKTRIALEAASGLAEKYSDGACFVPLAPVSSSENIIQTITDSLDLSFFSEDDPMEQLIDYLRTKEMLLLMDNFEQLVDGAGLLLKIVNAAPGVTMLVTSRHSLNTDYEFEFRVNGLKYPKEGDSDDQDTYSALELFAAAARRVTDFELSWDLKPLVTEICRMVEGAPLAIELAASWLQSFSVDQIYHEISSSFNFLGTVSGDILERHQSLAGVIEYSMSLLSVKERHVLEALSCFRGKFDAKAAQFVAGSSLQILDSLLNKSLIRRNFEDQYDIHEVTRQYANASLQKNPDQYERVRKKHSEYFSNLLQSLESRLRNHRRKETIDELSGMLENLRAAWEWAVDNGRIDIIGKCLKCFNSLYMNRGWYRSCDQLFSMTLEKLEKIPDSESTEGRELTAGMLCMRLGWLRVCRGDYSSGEENLSKGLAVFRKHGNVSFESQSLYCLSSLSLFRGDFKRAEERAVESLSLALEAGDILRQANALNALGNIARRKGLFSEAAEFYSDSLKLFAEIEDTVGRSICLGNLGIVAFRTGDLDKALDLALESQILIEEIDDQRLIAEGYSDLANILRSMGRLEESGEYYAKSLRLNRELGIKSAIAITLVNIARYESTLENYVRADRLLIEACEIAEHIGRRAIVFQTFNARGCINLEQDQLEQAELLFREALEREKGMQIIPEILDTLTGLADIYLRTDKRSEALDLLAFVLEHSENAENIHKKAKELLAGLKESTATEEIASAKKKASSTTLDDLIEHSLSE